MVIFPNAKINIGLRIVEKRNDGFHNLETVFYPVELKDAIEFTVPVEQLTEDHLTVTGIISGCSSDNNLVIKSVEKLRQHISLPYLKIHLHKVIPVGAGLGGGSSDAAHMLKHLNRFFDNRLTVNELESIASEIGSDCPFFIQNTPVYAEGRGEIMHPVLLNLKGYWLVLLSPGIHISTREAFENCRPYKPENSLKELIQLPPGKWKDLIVNDFEEYVFTKYPLIKEFKEELYRAGAIYSSMSGSGSSVYGFFNKKPEIPQTIKRNTIFFGIL